MANPIGHRPVAPVAPEGYHEANAEHQRAVSDYDMRRITAMHYSDFMGGSCAIPSDSTQPPRPVTPEIVRQHREAMSAYYAARRQWGHNPEAG